MRRSDAAVLQRHGHPANGLNGQQLQTSSIPNPNNLPLGEIDRTSTLTTSLGTSFLLSNSDTLFGMKNHASFGASFDYGMTSFGASAELGVVQPNYVVQGSGVYLGPSGNPVSDGPVDVQCDQPLSRRQRPRRPRPFRQADPLGGRAAQCGLDLAVRPARRRRKRRT